LVERLEGMDYENILNMTMKYCLKGKTD